MQHVSLGFHIIVFCCMSDLSASYFLANNGRSANNLIWAQGYLGKKKGLCNFLHVYVYCFPAIYSIYL